MNIYLSGSPPTSLGDWRELIVSGYEPLDRGYFLTDPDAPWPTRVGAVLDEHYVGPYCMDYLPARDQARENVLQAMAIAQADLVFCWLPSAKLYGSHVAFELGFAAGLKKTIVGGKAPSVDLPPELPLRVFDKIYEDQSVSRCCELAMRVAASAIRAGQEETPRAMFSKFESRCKTCRSEIPKGDLIVWSRVGGPHHLRCYAVKKSLEGVVPDALKNDVLDILQEDNRSLQGEVDRLRARLEQDESDP